MIMKNNIKILIIGFGSIGQRHYRNLQKLGLGSVCVYDVAGVKDKTIKTADDISQPTLKKFNVVFVCNPNNMHIRTALLAAKAGCHLFIEKPLSHNLSGINKLKKICEKNKLTVMVGHNMRFHPCLKFIHNYLNKNKLGKVYGISFESGYYLPYWRPGRDYRKNYAAKKETGGGIILDDIHSFDLLFWLNNFKEVSETKFIYNKVSDLQIETEDFSLASFKFKNKVLGLVSCDYLQQSYTWRCKIVGQAGNLEWDFNNNIVWLRGKQGSKKLFAVKNFDFNKVYLDEVKYFLSHLGGSKKINSIKESEIVLRHCIERK
jgi:predicted dehydrogenase